MPVEKLRQVSTEEVTVNETSGKFTKTVKSLIRRVKIIPKTYRKILLPHPLLGVDEQLRLLQDSRLKNMEGQAHLIRNQYRI